VTLDAATIRLLGYGQPWLPMLAAYERIVRERNARREAVRARRPHVPIVRTDSLTPMQKRSIAHRHARGCTVPEIVQRVGVRRGLVLAYLRGRA
jgi:hypothetical protein